VFLIHFLDFARVVKWQARTFEGRMPKGWGFKSPRAQCRCAAERSTSTFMESFFFAADLFVDLMADFFQAVASTW
jgi:hypothetical protein